MRLLTLSLICFTSAFIRVYAGPLPTPATFVFEARGQIDTIFGDNPRGANLGDWVTVRGKILVFAEYPPYDMDILVHRYPGIYAIGIPSPLSGATWEDEIPGAFFYLEGLRHKGYWGEDDHTAWVDGAYSFSNGGLKPFRLLYSGGNDAEDRGVWLDLCAGEGSTFKLHDVRGQVSYFSLTAVPEPATAGLCALAVALFVLYRIRKRPSTT